MRKVILIIVTLAVVGAGFACLLWMQGEVKVATDQAALTPATRPTTSGSPMGTVGRGQGAWVVTYDRKTSLPLVRFRADEYVPVAGDQIRVEHPQAEFFIGPKRSQMIRIEGKTGSVVMAGEGPKLRPDNLTSTPIQPPSRGKMRDVVITYYPTPKEVADKKPTVTLKLNNAYFDNDTYEIATEDYVDDAGNKVAGRDVPLQLRGDAFDFDGKGLYIRWDDRSQRLKSMTIYQSDKLVIKKPLDSTQQPGKHEGAAAASPAVSAGAAPSPAPAGGKTPSAKPSNPADAPPVYRATFLQGVSVTQGNQELARAASMFIDFLAPDSNDDQAAPAQPTPSAANGSSGNEKQTAAATPAPAATADKSAGHHGILGKDDPVIVRWNGEMNVNPAPSEKVKPTSSDDAVVRLVGAPLVMQTDGYRIEAATAMYQVAEQIAWVNGADGAPVVMTDAKDNRLLTPQLRFNQKTGQALLRGAGSANIAVEQDGKTDALSASWKDAARAWFTPGESPAISRLQLEGDVQVQHPKIQKFKAGLLTVGFQPVSQTSGKNSFGPVNQIIAKKQVDCVLLDNDKPRPIRCENLKLDMTQAPDKTLYPSHIEADGNVVAGDADEMIKADSIRANLNQKAVSAQKEPSAQWAGLQDLVADGNVDLRSASDTATGQHLTVRAQDEKNTWLCLEGTPATVSRGQTRISGKLIEVNTAIEQAIITGGGQISLPGKDASSPAAASAKGQPMDVSWTGDARVDGTTNTAFIAGNVAMRLVDTDGSVNEAWGDRLNLVLDRDPNTVQKPRNDKKASKNLTFLADRYVKQLTLLPAADKEIQLQSLKMDGSFIDHQVTVFGPRLDCEFVLQTTVDKLGKVQSGMQLDRLTVPGSPEKPGRMLYVSMPPAARKAIKTQDPFKTGKLPGATAFAWQDKLLYERSSQQFAMLGPVLIRHQPQTQQGKPFEVRAQKIVCDLDPDGKDRRGSASGPGEVKRLVLTGQPVVLARPDATITCLSVEVHPDTGDVVARGTERNPVRVERATERGDNTVTFTEVYMNTETQAIQGVGVTGTGRK